MLIWILALLLIAFFAGIGFFKGAIRMCFSLGGLFIALLLARPLAPTVKPLIPLIGLKHPLWSMALPPILVFIILALVFFGLSFAVHWKIKLYYKYKTDDLVRLRWERLNQRLGVVVGVLTGSVYFFLMAWVIYVMGYLTVQISADENPAGIRFLNSAREDLNKTGLDKSIAALDRTDAVYYEIADILGIIYQNPIIHSRLNKYPPFLTMADKPEFQEIGGDKEYNEMLLNRANIAVIVQHPKTQAILANGALVDELKQIDLKDLRTYLEKGKSPKFEDQHILGRWHLDTDAVVLEVKKRKPGLSAAELTNVRKLVGMLSGVSVTATVDNKLIVKVDPAAQALAAGGEPAQPPPAPDPAAAALQQRYGIRPNAGQPGPGAQRPRTPAPAPAATPAPVASLGGGEGTWKSTDDGYEVTVPDQKGKQYTFKAVVEEGELILTKEDQSLIFNKEED